MKNKQMNVNSLFAAALISVASMSLSNSALADSFPFSATPSVTTSAATGAVKAAATSLPQKLSVKNVDVDAFSFPFLQGVALTAEQRGVFSQILSNQMPVISSNIETIEYARGLLRDMALAKTYDETIANIAADSIANGTAKLAVLQAEREYQVLALLTPEQVSELRK
jgi:Spy/CpxP family protein refolding chaperone